MEHIVIIGNGIAGITCARHIRKNSDKQITVISAESDYFFSRTALMYVYMGHMQWRHLKPYEDWFWEKNRIALKNAYVKHIDFDQKTLHFSSKETMFYDKLVLATGSVYNKFGWPGEDLDGVQGLVSKQDLELLEKNTKNCKQAVIVGGGLIGVELAEMLRTRNIAVKFLIREEAFWHNILPLQDAKFVSAHIKTHGIDLQENTELDKIRANKNNRVEAVETKDEREIRCDLVGLCAGVKPNIAFLKKTSLELDRGILVDDFLTTNIPDVYAIGDCAQIRNPLPHRKPIEAVWYVGRMMGETLAQTLTGNKMPYKPGNWFNSAKFFDIEYQTYGKVSPTKNTNEKQLHWEHHDKTKAVTIAFNPKTEEFLGINIFDIRMRHAVIDNWLTKKASLQQVLQNLESANFDPEFYKTYEKEIFRSFQQDLTAKTF
ncbi:NAD(P)/FAD-dependent oxidoreductase [Haloflavibacter putidus]|uniref:NAD(P)/FAD-dependent oxidoreductase n=1 Tax=Haloflavibacter putidus TaxID=2576776 RepID=A0A507ZTN5_9FLAO|nr:FAD/NAD(P)-binding oxidoreductase [Haloflavibacter putidus]TQD39098.1 NAD(P)/FAD-dependent oxidoreductase [Haloflavibacter putidus]